MSKIIIGGLGPGSYDLMSVGVLRAMKNAKKIYMRTRKHPVIDELEADGFKFESLDYFYESEESFEKVYENIADFIVEKGKEEEILYCVPGHPKVAENSVTLIQKKARALGIEVELIASMSFVDAMFETADFDPVNGFYLLDAMKIDAERINPLKELVITQVYDRFIAGQVKIRLMEHFDPEHLVYVVKNAGIRGKEEVIGTKLYELDHIDVFDYLTSLYVKAADKKSYGDLEDLESIMAVLRSEDGCPWDRKQTHDTLKSHLIEEAYELYDAIEKDDLDEMIEELGDVLLQVVFHSQIGKEDGFFDMRDVIRSICDKLVYRHPHVFEGETIDEDNYLQKWESLKQEEKGEESVSEGIARIPKHLPALIKANKIQKKAALVGFDWDDIADVFKKIEEEYKEVVDAYRSSNIQYIEEEIGDLLFSVVNLARFLKIDPEEAINKTSSKFLKRFTYVEENALKQGKTLDKMTLDEMDDLWNEAKREI